MDIFERQLRSIRKAYAVGRVKPVVEVSDGNPPQNQSIATYTPISSAEQDVLDRCRRHHATALQASRQGEYSMADTLLAAAEQCIQTSRLSPAGKLVAQSAHEAAAAYLDYRRENFEAGITHIYRALFIDATLEDTYGYVYFYAHRIRLLLNLLRLKRRQSEEHEALRIGFALIDYLEQKIPSLPFPTSWNAGRLQHLSSAQQNFFFEQAIFEIIFLVAGRVAMPEGFSAGLDAHTCSESSTYCVLSPRSHLWLQARQTADPGRFLELVCPLVAAGPGDAVWLWYGILIDLVILCSTCPLEQARLLLQDIAGDMAVWKWSSLPPSWKLVFQKALAEE